MKYALTVMLAAGVVALAGLGTAPQKADAYWVCPPTAAVWHAGNFLCGHATYRSTINYIEKDSDPRTYAVYRSSAYYGGSISGLYYYSPTSNYFMQTFSCHPGYPNAINLMPTLVYVAFTLAGSC